MSNGAGETNRMPIPHSLDSVASQRNRIRWVGAGLQLLAIALCMEMLVGVSAGLGLLLRLSLLSLIAFCIVMRLGWVALVALQVSLIAIEPRQNTLSPYPVGFFYVLVASAVIVAAMKAPETHRFVTDYLVSLFVPESNALESNRQFRFTIMKLSYFALQLMLTVVVAGFLLNRLPIGLQAESWLDWSRQNGQAVWPGALLMVLVIAILVLVRENAWRQILPSQASLYLRSVQLIANYRDLFGFERHRLRRLRKAHFQGVAKTLPPVKRPKLRRSSRNDDRIKKGMK
ncbi:MAG: hypothetical protein NTY15_16730 [Planctomycetota bacterium]|nr:hypothetical protein [Planctomycetota bacterium]